MIQTIEKRKSIRTFLDQRIPDTLLDVLKVMCTDKEITKGPFGNTIALTIFEKGAEKITGTYGVIKNPQAYLAGSCQNQAEALMDFGYVMERLILEATNLDLGTCWLGGTFKRNDFIQKMTLEAGAIIPCVTPLGYQAKNPSLLEKGMRYLAKAKQRKPFETLFFLNDFDTPLTEIEPDILLVPLNMVRIGPSASNQQPWRVLVHSDQNRYDFYLETTKGYAGNKMGFEMQRIDMGIAICHFQLACQDLGIDVKIRLVDEPVQKTGLNYCLSFEVGKA